MLLHNSLAIIWSLILLLPLVIVVLASLSVPWRWLLRLLAAGIIAASISWLVLVLRATTIIIPNVLHIVPLTATLLVLILFIAFIVLRYAATNFEGDPNKTRFLQRLLLTIVAVMITVASNHLWVFWLGWIGISLSLHQLLVFYPDRPRAILAAHKKFILARMAELLLATAFILLHSHHHTWIIADILAQYPVSELHWQQQVAACLLALVALIKCAQLPIHGWLIQVVEAPTPVSALLHAGVINLGGFLLLLFSPLFSQVWLAQSIIVLVAGISTVLAALIMMTRISIKVRLAWSTTAQMGLMLVECALGLYELALLHLVAHSCYKAYAFLSAGDAVNQYLRQQYAATALPKFTHYLIATLLVSVLITGVLQFWPESLPLSPWLLIGIALVMVLASRFSLRAGHFVSMQSLLLVMLLLVAYLGLKTLVSGLLPAVSITYHWLADLWVSGLFVGLWIVYLMLSHFPSTRFSQRLFVALNAGLYLDEWATRLTLRLWPIGLPRTTQKALSISIQPEAVQ
jgi:NAD(P)H-quinone oxidoreductase subunit 5